jgi:hypothetical protein
MHGRMDSDDEESDNVEEENVPDVPEADVDIEVDAPRKFGSDSIEIDPENDPIRLAPHRSSDSKKVTHPVSSAPQAPKKNVKSMTLAERLLLDKKVNDGQRVEVRACFFSPVFVARNGVLQRKQFQLCVCVIVVCRYTAATRPCHSPSLRTKRAVGVCVPRRASTLTATATSHTHKIRTARSGSAAARTNSCPKYRASESKLRGLECAKCRDTATVGLVTEPRCC